LEENGFKNIEEIIHEPVGEIIPERIEIRVGKDSIAFIYYPIACHNYNTITIGNQEINVATIDTILSFYLAFIYSDEYSYFRNRILCMANFLFYVEEQNRLEQKGLLKRFSINCIGKQPGLEEIRAEKALKFKEMATKKGTREYEMWFLKYNPEESKVTNKPQVTNKPHLEQEEESDESSDESEEEKEEEKEEEEEEEEEEISYKKPKKIRGKKKTSMNLMGSLFDSITYSVKNKRKQSKQKKTRKQWIKGVKRVNGKTRINGKKKINGTTRKRFNKRKQEGYLY